MNLTTEERNKFAAYCEQEAHGYEQLAKQAEEKLSIGDDLVKLLKLKAFAFGTVAQLLRDVEECSI